MKIGFFDSGIGGLTVLHQAVKLLPKEDYLFYADTANVPYGEKTREEVRQYIVDAADFIARQHVKALVIACNTATSIVIEELRQRYDFPILGIEPAVKPAIEKWEGNRKKVLVVATNLTLKEKKYNELVERLDHEEIVHSLPLPGLVQLAESFRFNQDEVVSYLKEAFAHLDVTQYGTVVLGCTHFPYFEMPLKSLFPEGTDFISGSLGTAKHLKRILEANNEVNQEGTGEIAFFKSGVKVEDAEELRRYHGLFDRLDDIERLKRLGTNS